MAKTPAQPQPQQGSTPASTQQQGQAGGSGQQQQGGKPIFRDWASI